MSDEVNPHSLPPELLTQPGEPSGVVEQAEFVAAVEAFLIAGGGLISFHHGSYEGSGKAAMQEIIGAAASGSVPWNTTEGRT